MTDYQLNNKQIFTVAIVSVVVTFITILACQVVYYALRDQHEEALLQRSNYRIGNTALREQSESIDAYGVDAETGNLQIPIGRAMELVVDGEQESAAKGEENPDEA